MLEVSLLWSLHLLLSHEGSIHSEVHEDNLDEHGLEEVHKSRENFS